MTRKMSWYERLGYNPLILRAFRTGFRSGRGNFRIGVWGILLILTLGVVALGLFGRYQTTGELEVATAARACVITLLFYLGAVFVFGGIQRMLVSLSGERERGTWDFLHLSTLQPRAIIWGLMLAGHLPGYLLLVILFPLLLVGGWLGEYHLGYLTLIVVQLVGMTIFASLMFQLLSFWTKRASDLRTLALLLFLLGVLVTTLIGLYGHFPLQLVGFFPALLWTYRRAASGGMLEAGTEFPFFTTPVALEFLVAALLVPIAVLCYRSLSRCLRHRERRPVTAAGATFLLIWLQIFLLGMYWPYTQGVTMISVAFSWLVVGQLMKASLRSQEALSRYLWMRERHRLTDPSHAPAYGQLFLLVVVAVAAGLAPHFQPNPLGGAWSAILIALPLSLSFLFLQWLQLSGRTGGLRQLALVWSLGLVWLPLVAGAMTHMYGSDNAIWVFALSPLGQVILCDVKIDIAPLTNSHWALIAALQGVYFLAAVGLVFLNVKAWRAQCAAIAVQEDALAADEPLAASVTDTTSQFAETTVIRPEDITGTE